MTKQSPRFWIGCAIVLIATLLVITGGYIWLRTNWGEQSDDDLIGLQLNPKLPGFSEIMILKREVYRNGRDLQISVRMDGESGTLNCLGTLRYRSGDPYISHIIWQEPICATQVQAIWDARHYLFEFSTGDDLPENVEDSARLLSHWINEGMLFPEDK